MILIIYCLIILVIILLIKNIIIDGFNATQDIKISVIILNYNRPHNIRKLVERLIEYKKVGEIIISHGKKDTEVLINNPKVINETYIRNKYYSMARFYVAKQAKYDLILYLDDDILISEDELNKLINNAVINGYNNLYGPVKRKCSIKGYYTNWVGDSDNLIVLTKIGLISKKTSLEVLNLMEKNKNIYDLVLENKGNGEDILFATTLTKNNLGKNIYVNINYTDLDGSNGYSSKTDHYIKRTELCKLIYK